MKKLVGILAVTFVFAIVAVVALASKSAHADEEPRHNLAIVWVHVQDSKAQCDDWGAQDVYVPPSAAQPFGFTTSIDTAACILNNGGAVWCRAGRVIEPKCSVQPAAQPAAPEKGGAK